jgi:hypothetical protein
MRGRPAPPDRPRRDDIDAAVAAYNRTTGELLLSLDAVRLLTTMFRGDDLCQRSLRSFRAEGINENTIRRLLPVLIAAGFVSKESAGRGVLSTYRLHLPLRRQP